VPTEPEPWSTTGLLILLAVVVGIELCVAALGYVRDRGPSYAEYIVVQPYQPLPLLFLLAFLVAMPPAQRLGNQPRRLRVLESLSVAALALLLVLVLGGAALGATARSGIRIQVAALGLAELAALGLDAVLYPRLYRRFWMTRRRSR